MHKQIILHLLRNTMPGGDNVKSIDQSATASAGSDTYVSLSKQETMVLNDEFRTKVSRVIVVSDLPRETAEAGFVAADDPPLRDLFRDDWYAATCKTQLPGFACN